MPVKPILSKSVSTPEHPLSVRQSCGRAHLRTRSTIQATDSSELLREIGGQTFDYRHPPVAEECISQEKTNKELDTFVKKVSIFAIVKNMDGEITTPLAMEIVNESYRTGRSVLDLFFEKSGKNFSWWGKICVWCNYHLYYSTGIVHNTIETFMRTFLTEMRPDSKQGGEEKLKTIKEALLNDISSFLVLYLNAIKEYAAGTNITGDRDTHIVNALAKNQKMPLELICKSFAKIATRKFVPRVPCFNSWKEDPNSSVIRFIGRFFDYTLGTIFNRCILHPILKKIIPDKIQEIVNTGIIATQGLPFFVALTRGFLLQLQTFRAQIDSPDAPLPESAQAVPGSVQAFTAISIPALVKTLIEILELPPDATQSELRHILKEKENRSNESSSRTSEISKSVEESAIDGCGVLLAYFMNPKNSEELLYRLLNLANSTFNSPPSTDEQLARDFENLKTEMLDEASGLFETVIGRSVTEKIHGLSPERLQRVSQVFEREQGAKSIETAKILQARSQAISQNITAHMSIPLASLQQLKKSCAHLLTITPPSWHNHLANLTAALAFIHEQPSIPWSDVQKIISALHPLSQLPLGGEITTRYLEMVDLVNLQIPSSIVDDLDKLSDAIERYKNQTTVLIKDKRFSAIQSGVNQSIQPVLRCMIELNNQILHARTLQEDLTFDTSIIKDLRQIDALLQDEPNFNSAQFHELNVHLSQLREQASERGVVSEHLGRLQALHPKLMEECQAMQTLRTLIEDNGLLTRLGAAVQARAGGQRTSFHWKDIKNIPALRCFPEVERILLQERIDAVAASYDNKNIRLKWAALTQAMQTIFSSHRQKNTALQQEVLLSCQESLQTYEKSLQDSQHGLFATSQQISSLTQNISAESAKIHISRVESIPSKVIGALGGHYFYDTIGTVAVTAVSGVGMGILSLCTPISPYITAAVMLTGGVSGNIATRAYVHHKAQSVRDQEAVPQVMTVFKNMYDFALQSHVWKWAVTDTLKCINEAYSK